MASPAKERADGVEGDAKEPEGANGIWVFYKSSASIHGVAQVGGPPIYSFRKWIWLFLVMAMGTGLCIILFVQVQRLASFPTRTSVSADFETEVEYPAVTLCNLNQYTKSRIPDDPGLRYLISLLSEASEISRNTHPDTAPYTSATNSTHRRSTNSSSNTYSNSSSSASFRWSQITGPELHQLVWHTAQNRSDFLYMCTWDAEVVPCGDLFETVLTDLGVCYVFNGVRTRRKGGDGGGERGAGEGGGGGEEKEEYRRKKNSAFGAWTGLRVLMFINQTEYYYAKTMQTGVKVVLHEPEINPMPSTSGMLLRPGVSAHLAFTKTIHQGLAAPYRAYKNVYCVDSDSPNYDHQLKRYSAYTEMACYRECLLEYTVSYCNCTNPFEPEEDRPFCSVDQMLDCYLPIFKSFRNEDLYRCDCRPPCRRVVYDIKASYADFASEFMEEMSRFERNKSDENFLRRNVVDLRVFLDSLLVVRVEQEPEMTFTDILGTLGDIWGFFSVPAFCQSQS